MAKHFRFNFTLVDWLRSLLLALGLGLTSHAMQAQTYTDLHDFNINAGDPCAFVNGRVAQWPDGSFYAESNQAGAFGTGTIFQLTPSGNCRG